MSELREQLETLQRQNEELRQKLRADVEKNEEILDVEPEVLDEDEPIKSVEIRDHVSDDPKGELADSIAALVHGQSQLHATCEALAETQERLVKAIKKQGHRV